MTAPPESDRAAPAGSAAAIPERVAALLPQIAAAADEIEAERKLPPALVTALHEARLYRMLLPRPFKGEETDPLTFVSAIEAVAKVDASTAWVLCQNNVASMVAAFLAREVAEDIFGRDPRAVLAWGPGAGARAVEVEGGYRATGNFSFASGGRHATWLGALSQIVGDDGAPRRGEDGAIEMRTLLLPAEKAPLKDIWDVIGLRGTGSDAYSISDLFVPRAYSVARDDQSERRYRGVLYAMSTNSLFSCGFACVALGIARSLLDALVALAKEKTPRGFKHSLAQSGSVQLEVGEAEAELRAARMYIMGTLAEVWRAVERSNALTLDQRLAIRIASTHTIQRAKSVADWAYHAAGATAIFASNAFERRFRDINTVAQQVQGRRAHFETYGKILFGIETDQLFF
ncbi:MAG TPA: acyl-CoA dehydrogenase family protein [Stellaceae bacterium]|nr:acyl-CoA dehydrogenase family protein [Stellaceae bacterium]